MTFENDEASGNIIPYILDWKNELDNRNNEFNIFPIEILFSWLILGERLGKGKLFPWPGFIFIGDRRTNDVASSALYCDR